MATFLDEKTRAEHYAQNRKKKKTLERGYDIIFWIFMIPIAFSVVPSLIGGFIKLFALDFLLLLEGIGLAIMYGAGIFALYKHRMKITACVMLVVAIFSAFIKVSAECIPVILVFVFLLDRQWEKLEQEEGFPLFDISYREQEEQPALATKRAKYQAVQLGARVAHVTNEGAMNDLLDDGKDAPVVAGPLSGYHDKFRNSVLGYQPPKPYQTGVMDDILSDLQPATGKDDE